MTKPDANIYELIDKKLDKVEGRIVRRLDRIDDRLDVMDQRDEEHSKELATLKEKSSNQKMFQSALTIVSSAIAAFLGVRK